MRDDPTVTISLKDFDEMRDGIKKLKDQFMQVEFDLRAAFGVNLKQLQEMAINARRTTGGNLYNGNSTGGLL